MDKVLAIATPRLLPQLKKIKDKSVVPTIHLLVNTKANDEVTDGSISLNHFATFSDITIAYKMSILFPFYFQII